jgi:hypothetical protein
MAIKIKNVWAAENKKYKGNIIKKGYFCGLKGRGNFLTK